MTAADIGHVFALSGPTHLPAVDWSYTPHRRSVAATLVRAGYVLEYDRLNNRQGHEALAPPWWAFFHFQLIEKLLDDDGSSIFGAIFEYKPPSVGCKHYMTEDTPKYVIAFRGTILKDHSFGRDLKLDFKIILNGLHRTSCVDTAMAKVVNFIEERDCRNIWIAGHSLGSSVGMYVGKHLAKEYDILLETYLFNPPFISPSLEWIKSKRIKRVVHIAKGLTKVGHDMVAKGLDRRNKKADDPFEGLSAWVPCLFVHSTDPICAGYISYFEGRKDMDTTGLAHIEKLAMKISRGSLYLKAAGFDSESLHLLPSASLTKNLTHPKGFMRSHELAQWWKTDMSLQSHLYQA